MMETHKPDRSAGEIMALGATAVVGFLLGSGGIILLGIVTLAIEGRLLALLAPLIFVGIVSGLLVVIFRWNSPNPGRKATVIGFLAGVAAAVPVFVVIVVAGIVAANLAELDYAFMALGGY